MVNTFNNHDAKFKVGYEIPDNDVGLMYYEVPGLTPNKSLTALSNINLLEEMQVDNLGFTKELYTNPDGILFDEHCNHFIVTSQDFTITDKTMGSDDEPVYYKYELRYLHESESGNIEEEITIYLNDEEYEKNDYYLEYEEVENNLYEITIYTDYKDNDYDMYSIEYYPDSINIDNYQEIINFENIYKRTYQENPDDDEYFLTEEEGTNYIVTNYPASTTEEDYHNDTKTGFEDAEFDYKTSIEGYRADEGEGVFVYFLVDASYSMKSSSGFASTGYKSHEVAVELGNNIIDDLNNLSPDGWEVNYHFSFFNATGSLGIADDEIHRFPSKRSWYNRDDLSDVGSIYPDIYGTNPDFRRYVGDAINELTATKEDRSGHKTIFVFMSDGRDPYTTLNEAESLQDKLFDSKVDYIWSFIIGPEYDSTSWGGYRDEDIELMEKFGEGDYANFLKVDREDSNAKEEDEAAQEFEDSKALPQKITQTLKKGTASAPGSYCTTEWKQFVKINEVLSETTFYPEELFFIGDITGPDCLDSNFYFGYESISNELELTDEYIDWEEV